MAIFSRIFSCRHSYEERNIETHRNKQTLVVMVVIHYKCSIAHLRILCSVVAPTKRKNGMGKKRDGTLEDDGGKYLDQLLPACTQSRKQLTC